MPAFSTTAIAAKYHNEATCAAKTLEHFLLWRAGFANARRQPPIIPCRKIGTGSKLYEG